jgi:hypothetical protein
VSKFIEACRQLRLWKREAAVHLALAP